MAEQQEALVQCGTTKGPFTIRLVRKWSPLGYDRAVALFQRRFYDHSHFFRTVHGFLVQFGLSYTTDEDLRRFANTPIRDDPQLDPPIPFGEGTLSYAGSGPNSRTSQLFIAYDKVPSLGKELWETPIGKVIEGMDNIRNFFGGYGDMPPWGHGPEQGRIRKEGAGYMEKNYPLMDKFETCKVEIVYPNLFEYDERDMKNADFKEQEDQLYLRLGKIAGGARVKNTKQKEIHKTSFGYLRDPIGDLPAVALAIELFGLAAVALAIACFLKRNRKGAEKTN